MDESPRGANPPPPQLPGDESRLSNLASVKWRLAIWFVISCGLILQFMGNFLPKAGNPDPVLTYLFDGYVPASSQSLSMIAGGCVLAHLVASAALAVGLLKRPQGASLAATIALTAMLFWLVPMLAGSIYFASCCSQAL